MLEMLIAVPLKDGVVEKLKHAYPQFTIRTCKRLDEATDEDLNVTIVVAYNSQLKPKVLQRLSAVRWIHVFSAGVDNLPLLELEQRGVTITNSSGAHRTPMAEFAIGVMLQEVKNFIPFYQSQQQSVWDRKTKLGELDSKTLTVLGTGAIGQEIAKRVKVFGMRTLGVNRSGRLVESFDMIYTQDQVSEALAAADYVIVVAPLTSSTRNWLTGDKLRAMKQDAVFINLGRGELVDEEALVQVLQEGALKRAYLDVFHVEPLPVESPLWKLPNCVIFPHISAISDRYSERCLEIFLHNLECYLDGRTMINIVEAERGY